MLNYIYNIIILLFINFITIKIIFSLNLNFLQKMDRKLKKHRIRKLNSVVFASSKSKVFQCFEIISYIDTYKALPTKKFLSLQTITLVLQLFIRGF